MDHPDEPVRRQVVIFGKDGKLLYRSPDCEITPNADGSLTVKDMTREPARWYQRIAHGIAPGWR